MPTKAAKTPARRADSCHDSGARSPAYFLHVRLSNGRMESGVKNPSPKELSPQETWWLHLESPLSPDDKTQLLIGMEDWDPSTPQPAATITALLRSQALPPAPVRRK